MKKGEIERALGLFNQSLSYELCNERWAGAAIDYTNIALAQIKRKKHDDANKNFLTALSYAEEAGNEQLRIQIQKIFNSLKDQN